MELHKDWWKYFFNDIYLITDARSVCNPELTRREVTLLEETLSLQKHDTILDLCGGYGRHSLELAKRGYSSLTVLDFSPHLIRYGKKLAQEKEFKNITFLRRDARASRLKSDTYSVVFMMANSFGYFPDERENILILKEIYRVLKKGGKILLDLTDSHLMRKNLAPFSWHEANKDVIVCRERCLKGNIVNAREVVISKKKGLLRDGAYCMRIYSKQTITQLLKKTGYRRPAIKTNLSLHRMKKDYGLMTQRMLITAIKA